MPAHFNLETPGKLCTTSGQVVHMPTGDVYWRQIRKIFGVVVLLSGDFTHDKVQQYQTYFKKEKIVLRSIDPHYCTIDIFITELQFMKDQYCTEIILFLDRNIQIFRDSAAKTHVSLEDIVYAATKVFQHVETCTDWSHAETLIKQGNTREILPY